MSEKRLFRTLDVRDLGELMAIERSGFDNPWSAQVMRDSLSAAHTKGWGLVDEFGKLFGYAVFSILMDEAELLSMIIHPDHQGQGCGASMLKKVMDESRSGGAETLFLEVRSNHDAAVHLYTKLGFKQIGVRKAYYPRPNSSEKDDALLMSLDLTTDAL